MSEWVKPVPSVNEETQPFWDALTDHTFLMQRCAACGATQHYYRAFCASCWSDEVADVAVSGEGRVWTHTTIWRTRAPGFADDAPYVVALVELAEGIRVFGTVESPATEHVRIDTPVRLKYVDTGAGFTLPVFEVAPDGADATT